MATLLDGMALTPERLYGIGTAADVHVGISDAAWERIRASRRVIDDIVKKGDPVYGINTGFGYFATTRVTDSELGTLQRNLIVSHAAGVGAALPQARVRMLLALRLNVFCKGHSGIRPETVEQMRCALNKNVLPYVPEKGTVGASGDLAPLAHLALGLIGEGKLWDPAEGAYGEAAQVLARHGLRPIVLSAKEGLAMINGTQFMARCHDVNYAVTFLFFVLSFDQYVFSLSSPLF